MKDLLEIFSLIVAGLFILVPIGEIKKEYNVIGKALMSVLIFKIIIKKISPLITYVSSLFVEEYAEYFTLLIKCLGITLLTKAVADICRDLGSASVGEKAESLGAIVILLLILPLLDTVLSMVEGLM